MDTRSLWVSDRPLSQSGELKRLTCPELQSKFGFNYTEDPCIHGPTSLLKGISPQLFQEVAHRAQHPLNEDLVVCLINENVGYGVFTRKPIPAGTIVCVYTGEFTESIEKSDYSMIIPDSYNLDRPNLSVDAQKTGGIGRFFQHAPEEIDELLKNLLSADQPTFTRLLKGNQISTTLHMSYIDIPDKGINERYAQLFDQSKPHFDALFRGEQLQESDFAQLIALCQYKLKKEFLSRVAFSSELAMKPFLQTPEMKTKLACANVRSVCILRNDQPISYYIAMRDIAAGEQLLRSYGAGYWLGRPGTVRYFHRNGTMLEPEDYLPILTSLLGQYKTDNKEQALRRAVNEQSIEDVRALLEYGANPNDIPLSQKTVWNYVKGNKAIEGALLYWGAKKPEKTPLLENALLGRRTKVEQNTSKEKPHHTT